MYWLEGYEDRQFPSSGFTKGFSIQFNGSPFNSFHPNHNSAARQPHLLRNLINKEVEAGRVAGPFSSPPFSPFVVSPLGLVPKKEPNKFRVIHDLSYPHGQSVNFFISADDAAVSYETFDRVVELVQAAGPGALLAKVDIENAFRIIPIHPADPYLLGFAIGDDFYYDRCLPMGCRSSCAIFESFSSALQWVAMNKLSIPAVTHILDDFIFIGPANTRVTSLSLESFLLLCKDCGIPIKTSKTVLPSTCVIAHGIEIDTKSMEARLPE
jgi:hypothetical protein